MSTEIVDALQTYPTISLPRRGVLKLLFDVGELSISGKQIGHAAIFRKFKLIQKLNHGYEGGQI